MPLQMKQFNFQKYASDLSKWLQEREDKAVFHLLYKYGIPKELLILAQKGQCLEILAGLIRYHNLTIEVLFKTKETRFTLMKNNSPIDNITISHIPS